MSCYQPKGTSRESSPVRKPTKEALKTFHELSKKEIKRLFNTSGNVYKELNLKDKLKDMPDEEKFELLSSNGMLIKRPLLVLDENVLIGFKEEEYNSIVK